MDSVAPLDSSRDFNTDTTGGEEILDDDFDPAHIDAKDMHRMMTLQAMGKGKRRTIARLNSQKQVLTDSLTHPLTTCLLDCFLPSLPWYSGIHNLPISFRLELIRPPNTPSESAAARV